MSNVSLSRSKPRRRYVSGTLISIFALTIIAEAGSAVVQAPFRGKDCPPPNVAFGQNWMASGVLAYGSFPSEPNLYGARADEMAKESFEIITRKLPAKVAACYALPSNYLVRFLQERQALKHS